MHYSEFHNHKWAKNLAHARRLVEKGDFETFYRGEDLPNENPPDGDVFPGMRLMSAYWISVEHEMKMRLDKLLEGADKPGWRDGPALLAQRDEFTRRFLEDMRELVVRENIVPAARIDALEENGFELPEDWVESVQSWQQESEETLEKGETFTPDLMETWFDTCLRSIANYNHYLIWGGVNAAALVKLAGEDALQKAVDAVAESFKWDISREFYVHVLPAAGFEDIGDLMELGMRGMYSDQYYVSGQEREEGDRTVKESLLKNCELAGIYHSVAEWNELPRLSLGYGVCRFCEVHGEATMEITIPPSFSPAYRRVESIGMDDKTCRFELVLTPADDMERLMMVQMKVFGGEE
jgi:hypothetical protein